MRQYTCFVGMCDVRICWRWCTFACTEICACVHILACSHVDVLKASVRVLCLRIQEPQVIGISSITNILELCRVMKGGSFRAKGWFWAAPGNADSLMWNPYHRVVIAIHCHENQDGAPESEHCLQVSVYSLEIHEGLRLFKPFLCLASADSSSLYHDCSLRASCQFSYRLELKGPPT